MIPRYSRPEMTAIWTPEARYAIWFEIEAHATEKLAELGVVPQSAADARWAWWATKPAIDVVAYVGDLLNEVEQPHQLPHRGLRAHWSRLHSQKPPPASRTSTAPMSSSARRWRRIVATLW